MSIPTKQQAYAQAQGTATNILVNGKPANGTNASGVTFTSTPAPNPTTGPVSGLTQAQIDALRQQQMANQIQNQGA